MTETDYHLQEVWVVIAAYNEAGAIGAVLDDVALQIPAERIIVVDDASTDGTGEIARSRGVRIVSHGLNRGQGAALATGMAAALRHGAAIIVTFDADGQHRADDIPMLVEPVVSGKYDVVLGSRFLPAAKPGVPFVRRVILRLAVLFTRVISRIRVTDTHMGLRAISRSAAMQIRITQDRMAHASQIIDQIAARRLRFVERPAHVRYSEYSLAKGQRNRDAIKILIRVILDKVTG